MGGYAGIYMLAASLKDDSATMNRQKKRLDSQPFAKLKELQANTQANAFAAHLILPNRTQSPPTTRPVDG